MDGERENYVDPEHPVVLSAGAVEYTDCFSAEG